MDSRRRRTGALIFTPADLGFVSVALHQEGGGGVLPNALMGSYLESRRAAAQPSLPLTDAALQVQPLLQERILCTGWRDSSPFFVYSATPPRPQIKAIAHYCSGDG